MTELVTKLHEQIILAIKKTTETKKIGLAFSGGVDSSLLAKFALISDMK